MPPTTTGLMNLASTSSVLLPFLTRGIVWFLGIHHLRELPRSLFAIKNCSLESNRMIMMHVFEHRLLLWKKNSQVPNRGELLLLPALGPSALSSILGSSRDALRRAVIHRGRFTPALQRPPRPSVHGECSLRLLCEFFRGLRVQNVPVPTRPPLHWPPLMTVHREKLGLQVLLRRVKERGRRFRLLADLQRHNLHHVCDRCSRLLDRIRQTTSLKRPSYSYNDREFMQGDGWLLSRHWIRSSLIYTVGWYSTHAEHKRSRKLS